MKEWKRDILIHHPYETGSVLAYGSRTLDYTLEEEFEKELSDYKQKYGRLPFLTNDKTHG